MFRILIADDHILVQRGLESIIRETLGNDCEIDFASCGKDILMQLSGKQYDILTMEPNIPSYDGIDLLYRSLSIQPNIKILVVTTNQENIYAPRCLHAGAYGYLAKNNSESVVREAISKISKGKKFISDELANMFSDSAINGKTDNPFDRLSTREFEVATLLLKGHGAIEVSNALSINTSTASSYRARVFAKLRIKTFVDLMRLARKFHIVDNT